MTNERAGSRSRDPSGPISASFGNSAVSTSEDNTEEDTEDVTNTTEELEVVAEEDLLSMIQMTLFDQYKVSCQFQFHLLIHNSYDQA